MATNHVVVDVDAHYQEDIADLAQYLEDSDPWKMRIQEEPGKMLPSSSPDHYLYGRIQRDEVGYLEGDMSPEDAQTAMEHVGVDKILMLSHNMLSFSRIGSEDRRPMVLARGYVEYMLDRIVDPSAGIYTAIPCPPHDPQESVELIDEYADESGIVGICLVTNGPEPPLGHRRYDVIYEAAQRKGLPIIFHGGGSNLDDFYVDGYERFIESHSLGFLWNNMAQLTSVLIQGVPEKFPDIDFVFQEAGITWVPAYLSRLDTSYMKRQSEAPLLEGPPSEYAREMYFGVQPMERPQSMDYLEAAIEALGGADQLMYASDFPHWDYDPPNVVTDLPFLSEAEKAKILGANAEEVFDI